MLIRGAHTTLMNSDPPSGGGGGQPPAKPADQPANTSTQQPANSGTKPPASEKSDDKTTSEKVRLANELAATKAKLEQFEKAEAERAQAAAAADEERKKKLKEEGDLKKLHEEALKDVEKYKAKLAEIDADVKLGRSARETYTKQVTDAKAKLTDAQKSIVESLEKVDIVQAASAAAEFLGVNTKASQTPALPPGGGPPPPPGSNEQSVDVSKLLQDGMTVEEIQSKYPAAYTKYAQGFATKTKVTSIASFFKPKKTA